MSWGTSPRSSQEGGAKLLLSTPLICSLLDDEVRDTWLLWKSSQDWLTGEQPRKLNGGHLRVLESQPQYNRKPISAAERVKLLPTAGLALPGFAYHPHLPLDPHRGARSPFQYTSRTTSSSSSPLSTWSRVRHLLSLSVLCGSLSLTLNRCTYPLAVIPP